MRLIRSILAIVILSLLVCLVYLSLDWQSLKRAVVDADIYMLFLMLLAWGMLLLIRPLRLLVILKAMNPDTQVKYGTITKENCCVNISFGISLVVLITLAIAFLTV